MKTKTIYHLNYDCDKIVRIEVTEKTKKKKKRPIVINLERIVNNIEVKQFNDLLSSSVLNSLNQSKQKVQEAFSGSNRKA